MTEAKQCCTWKACFQFLADAVREHRYSDAEAYLKYIDDLDILVRLNESRKAGRIAS